MSRKPDAIPIVMDDDWWEAKCRLKQILNQRFATVLSDEDVFTSQAHYHKGFKNCPRTPASVKASGSSVWKMDEKGFRISFDLDEFAANELGVIMQGKYVEVSGKHKEREDQYGFVSREFCRRFRLPDNCDTEAVEADYSTDRKLTLTARLSGEAPRIPFWKEVSVLEEADFVTDGKEYTEALQRVIQEDYGTNESEDRFKIMDDYIRNGINRLLVANGESELPGQSGTDEESELSGECVTDEETELPAESVTNWKQKFLDDLVPV